MMMDSTRFLQIVALGAVGYFIYKRAQDKQLLLVNADVNPNLEHQAQVIPTGPSFEQIAANYENIEGFVPSDDYSTRQRKQVAESKVLRRIIDISYYPVDNIKLMHDLDEAVSTRLSGDCFSQTIHDALDILIYGNPGQDAYATLEDTAAKAYLKSRGMPVNPGVTLDDVCP